MGMRGATETGIVGADHSGDAVQHTLGELRSIDEMFAHLLHAAADGEIIVAGSNDQVGPHYGPVVIHLVVVNQSAARRFDHANAFEH